MTLLVIAVAIILISFGFVVLRGAPYVPSHRKQLRQAFGELYKIGKQDVVVDLGSGDGAVIAMANEYGAKALGYEINPLLWIMTTLRFWGNNNARVELRDYQSLSRLEQEVTVVYAFTTSHSIEGIGRKLEQWSANQELYFISYGFTLKSHKPIRSVGPMYLYRFSK
jgi:hypothetical protein